MSWVWVAVKKILSNERLSLFSVSSKIHKCSKMTNWWEYSFKFLKPNCKFFSKFLLRKANFTPGWGLVKKNNVRLAVNSGKKTFSTTKLPHFFAMNAVNFWKICGFLAVNICKIWGFSGENFIFTPFTGFLTKKKLTSWLQTSHLLHVNNFFFHCTICQLLH